MKTYISDTFPLKELECQFFQICKSYRPSYCKFNNSCTQRQYFRKHIEMYVAKDCLEEQIEGIINERTDGKKE